MKLHEDAVHRGPAQVIPAVRSAIQGGILWRQPSLLEPVQKVFISVPQNQMGAAVREIQGRRGVINDIQPEGDMTIIEGQAPVAELFGFASDIRGATEGRALWNTEFLGFFPVPANLQNEIVIADKKEEGAEGRNTEAERLPGVSKKLTPPDLKTKGIKTTNAFTIAE